MIYFDPSEIDRRVEMRKKSEERAKKYVDKAMAEFDKELAKAFEKSGHGWKV